MPKKSLFNDKSREYLREKLSNENFDRTTCSFYKYVNLKHPEILRDELYPEWKTLSILGRTYIAKEGINAQISIHEKNWDEFLETLLKRPEFKDVQIKIAIDEFGKSFQKLIVRLKPKIVADGLNEKDFDPTDTGKYLSAREFNEAIDQKYTHASNLRIGTEWRFMPFSIRGGYAVHGSPYKNGINDGVISSYSVGFGIRERNFFLDFTYVFSKSSEDYYLYSGELAEASVNTIERHRFQSTLGFKS